MSIKSVVILGGGFAGLWLACRLVEQGCQVEVLEKEPMVGGLMQSVQCDDFRLDLGPHIYFDSHRHHYERFLPEPLQRIRVYYGFGFRGRQIRSPLSPRNLLTGMSLSDVLRVTASLGWTRLFDSRRVPVNVEEWCTAKYGRLAYRFFFRHYIPKVTGLPPHRVSPDWATERERFYQQHNIWKKSLALLGSLLRRKEGEESRLTLYYSPKGAQHITDNLCRFIEKKGGRVRRDALVKDVLLDKGRRVSGVVFSHKGKDHKAKGDYYISTIPLPGLIKAMISAPGSVRGAANRLRFRDLSCHFHGLRRPCLMDKMQIYFPEKKYLFKRVYEDPSVHITPTDRTALCSEVCYGPGQEEDLPGPEQNSLVQQQLSSFYHLYPEEFTTSLSLNAPFAYAIYETGYLEHLKGVAAFLYGMDNLVSFGRSGLFRYNFLTDRIIDASEAVLAFIHSEQGKSEWLGGINPKGDFL